MSESWTKNAQIRKRFSFETRMPKLYTFRRKIKIPMYPIHANIIMWTRGGQLSIQGNVVNVPADVNSVVNTKPINKSQTIPITIYPLLTMPEGKNWDKVKESGKRNNACINKNVCSSICCFFVFFASSVTRYDQSCGSFFACQS